MTVGGILLGIYLCLVAASHFGMQVPGIFMGVIALLAGVAVLAGGFISGRVNV